MSRSCVYLESTAAVEPRRRLVEEDDPGVGDHLEPHGGPLLLAPGYTRDQQRPACRSIFVLPVFIFGFGEK